MTQVEANLRKRISCVLFIITSVPFIKNRTSFINCWKSKSLDSDDSCFARYCTLTILNQHKSSERKVAQRSSRASREGKINLYQKNFCVQSVPPWKILHHTFSALSFSRSSSFLLFLKHFLAKYIPPLG